MKSAGRSLFLAATVITLATLVAACTSSASGDSGGSGSGTRPATQTSTHGDTSSHGSTTATTTPSPTSTAYTPSLAQAPDDHPRYYTSKCQSPQTSSTSRICTFGQTKKPTLTVALVGDSTTNQWLAGVVAIGKKRGWKIVTDYHSRCPWSATMTVNTGETVPYTACYDWGKAALNDVLTKIKPDVVLTSDRPVLSTPENPTPGPASEAQIGEGMATYWRVALKHHIKVVPIRESPEMGTDIPKCLKKNSVKSCTVPLAKAIEPSPPTVVGTRAMNGAVHILNMNDVICPHGTCKPVAGNIVKFRDLHHLTATFVLSIVPQLEHNLLATGAFGKA